MLDTFARSTGELQFVVCESVLRKIELMKLLLDENSGIQLTEIPNGRQIFR